VEEFFSSDPLASRNAEFFSAKTDPSTMLVLPPFYEERRRKVERVKSAFCAQSAAYPYARLGASNTLKPLYNVFQGTVRFKRYREVNVVRR